MTAGPQSQRRTNPARRHPAPSPRRLADLPVWVLRSPDGEPLNCVLVSGPGGLIVINSGLSLRHGKALKRALAALSDRPVRAIVYPHHHARYCRGTAALVDPGAVAASEVVVLAPKGWSGQPDPAEVVPPNLLVHRECILQLAGVTVHVLPVGGNGHTGAGIYLPEHRVAMLPDDPDMWRYRPGPRAGTPLADLAELLLPLPFRYVLGSRLPPLDAPHGRILLANYRYAARGGVPRRARSPKPGS
ncbi:MBL fold metallo-hydrolase [Amycolatopsis aidingensis]|uniref:MBL fold metallo-hydrolase n=1 Tax=Amycolatopsis aidingensis TaxID=2842453 RepID=UPI001C0D3F99|nr:MBL fold metallo-hydrolase [Amycolatopsis aidingensis]